MISSPTQTELTGKEGNNLDERQTGEITKPGEYHNTYGRRGDTWPVTVEALRTIGAAQIQRETGFSRSSIYEVLRGGVKPHPKRQVAYEQLVYRSGRRHTH